MNRRSFLMIFAPLIGSFAASPKTTKCSDKPQGHPYFFYDNRLYLSPADKEWKERNTEPTEYDLYKLKQKTQRAYGWNREHS